MHFCSAIALALIYSHFSLAEILILAIQGSRRDLDMEKSYTGNETSPSLKTAVN